VKWEPTDQFGNLYIGESGATDLDTLRDDVADLIQRLRERSGERFTITVDAPYGEINGPDPEQVAYVLRVAWLPGAHVPGVVEMIRDLAATHGLNEITVRTG